WNATAAGSGGDGISHGVRAQGEAADGPRGPTPSGQAIQAERADDGEALSRHRREPRVDVEGGAFTRGEDEITALHRPREEQILEILLEVVVIEIGRASCRERV